MLRAALALLVALNLVGCSLVDPFVTRNLGPRPPADAPEKPPKPAMTGDGPSLPEAFEYAESVKRAYRGAIRDQSQLQAWLGIGLIPLTAAAMGLGASGGPATAVLALGLTGAASLGTGTWLYNKPRQLAWIAGIKAVTCAEDAMTPFALSVGVAQSLDTNVDSLRDRLAELETAAGQLETAIDGAKAVRDGADASQAAVARALRTLESLETAARAELTDVQAAIAAAEQAHKNGASLQQLFRVAGRTLAVAVSRITDEVDAVVVETQRDPQALANVIAGIGANFRMITTVPEGLARTPAKDAAARKDPSVPQGGTPTEVLTDDAREALRVELAAIKARQDALEAALRDARTASAQAARARRVVADTVNAVIKDTPVDKLKGCGVGTGDFVTAITVDPAPPFEVTAPGSLVFTIKGGLPPYGAVIAAGQSGLVISLAGPAVSVTATAATPEGQFSVVVRDSTGLDRQVKAIPITVKKAPPAAGEGDRGQPARDGDALATLARKLTAETPTVAAQGVTARIAKAGVSSGTVVLTVDPTQVAPDANTTGVARAFRDKVAEEHGKGAGVPADKIVFAPESIKALEKTALDQRKTQPQAGCVEPTLKGPLSDAVFDGLDRPTRERVQQALGLTGNAVDGQWGPITKGRLILYQCQKAKRTTDGRLTRELVDELLAQR